MHKIHIRKLTNQEKIDQCIHDWPQWQKGVSRFDWFFDTTEYCLIVEGKAIIETEHEKYEIKAGDFVSFPAGLTCVWDITEPIIKHYSYDYVF